MALRLLTVPNQLTFLRLAFLPLFVISIWYELYWWALGLLGAAALTDALDGWLARTLHQKSALGAYLDPIADKLLLSSSFLVLAFKSKIAWWLTILVFSRDVLIVVAAVVIAFAGGARRFPPSVYGKLTTVVQILLVTAVLLVAATGRGEFAYAEIALVYLVAALTVVSGMHYAVLAARKLSAPAESK